MPLDGVVNGPCEKGAAQFLLDNVVLSPTLYGLNGRSLVIKAGEDHDRYPGRLIFDAAERVQPAAVGEREVQDDDIERFLAKAFDGLAEPLNVDYLEG